MLPLLVGIVHASGQFALVPSHARSSALGGCHVPDTAMRRIGAGYRQGYAMAEMATRTMDVVWMLGDRGRVEAEYAHFGDRIYHEQQVVAGYSMWVTDWLSTGLRGRYLRMATGNAHYLPQQWLAAEVSMQAIVGDRLMLYAEGGSRPWDKEKPWMARIGMAYKAVEGLTTLVELDSDECMRLRAGTEYCYREHYFVRMGMATHPIIITFGLGMRRGIYGIDLAVESHEYLGVTPQISISLWP